MKKTAAFATLLALASPAFAADPDIGGKYTVAGTNADGAAYSGTADIEVTTKNTCRITWTTGSTTSTGICMRNGGAFSAAYVLGDVVGLVIYELKDDGSMEGLWTIADKEGVGSETLTPAK